MTERYQLADGWTTARAIRRTGKLHIIGADEDLDEEIQPLCMYTTEFKDADFGDAPLCRCCKRQARTLNLLTDASQEVAVNGD